MLKTIKEIFGFLFGLIGMWNYETPAAADRRAFGKELLEEGLEQNKRRK